MCTVYDVNTFCALMSLVGQLGWLLGCKNPILGIFKGFLVDTFADMTKQQIVWLNRSKEQIGTVMVLM